MPQLYEDFEALKGTISLGGYEKRKKKKTRKNRKEVKVADFSSASLFTARKLDAVTQCGTSGITYPTRRRTQGAGIVKGWEDERDRGHIPDTFT